MAIEGAQKNMIWFKFSKKDYSIINVDSRKIDLPEVSAIVTEPELGKILKKIPTKANAEKTLKDFEKLMVQVINNSKKKVSGRIVFSSPLIRIGKKRLSCNIKNICLKTGYVEVIQGIEEYRKNQIVGRKIFILRKN